MRGIFEKQLKGREPIRVAIIGSGWHGGGVARELYRIPGVTPRLLVDRDLDRAIGVYREMGVDVNEIATFRDANEFSASNASKNYIATSDIRILKKLNDIDVVYENTGDMLGGTEAALITIDKGLPLITANFEVDSAIGLRLAKLAEEKGVLYSLSDGDQPGVLSRIISDVTTWGFEPKIVGNCKGFMDIHQDPINVKPFVPSHQSNHMVTAMADGTKQAIEMVVLGNAYGYSP